MTHVMTLETITTITTIIQSDMFALEVLIHMGFSFMSVILALLVFEQVAGGKNYSDWGEVETPEESIQVLDTLEQEVSEMLADVSSCTTNADYDNLVVGKDPMEMTQEEWRAEVNRCVKTIHTADAMERRGAVYPWQTQIRDQAVDRLIDLGCEIMADCLWQEHQELMAEAQSENKLEEFGSYALAWA